MIGETFRYRSAESPPSPPWIYVAGMSGLDQGNKGVRGAWLLTASGHRGFL